VAPETEAELRAALAAAAERGVPVRALGGGTNLLVDDAGVRGLVVCLTRLKGIDVEGRRVVAKAGTSLGALLRTAVTHGLSGLECLAGVPGTVGGALAMNAGGVHGTIGERVAWVRGLTRRGTPYRFGQKGCGFRYRGSGLGGTFVTEAAFDLTPGGSDLAKRVKEILSRKQKTQPLDRATAGCMFRNPGLPGGESAGWLLDRVGLRGQARGGARFSPVHANFVENRGDATFRDIADLLREGSRRVREEYGVDLDLEVKVWTSEPERELSLA
jgi:UDP-N-acetylmuramate dehydrogenase